MTYIYGLKDPNTGRFCYVGRTQNIKQRMTSHLYNAHGKHFSTWIQALRATKHKPVVVILQVITEPLAPGCTLDEELAWAIRLAEEGHPILNQEYMPDRLKYPRHERTWHYGA